MKMANALVNGGPSKNALVDNTNRGSWSQQLLGSHKPLSKRQMKRMTAKEIAADRRMRARWKMVDMSPEQKKAELARLKAKYK